MLAWLRFYREHISPLLACSYKSFYWKTFLKVTTSVLFKTAYLFTKDICVHEVVTFVSCLGVTLFWSLSLQHYEMLTIQAQVLDSESGNGIISCAVLFCTALRTGHFNIRLDVTERANHVLHSMFYRKNIKHYKRDRSHKDDFPEKAEYSRQ